MIMKLYSGMKNFLIPVTITKFIVDKSNPIRPKKVPVNYIIDGNIALFDGTEDEFRPGGVVQIGDLYLQTIAGKIKAKRAEMPINETEEDTTIYEDIILEQSDIIQYLGVNYEIYYTRNEPDICDVADYYAHKQEVREDVRQD